MNYLPPDPLRLWDCWILPWEGEYHLIHLQYTLAELEDGMAANRWAGLGHAVSRDLVHWSHLEPLVDVGDRLLVADVPDRFAIDGT